MNIYFVAFEYVRGLAIGGVNKNNDTSDIPFFLKK